MRHPTWQSRMPGVRRLLVALMVVGMLVSGVSAAFADAGGRPNENAETVRICHYSAAGHDSDFVAGGPGRANQCRNTGGTLMRVAGPALHGHIRS